MSYLINDSYNNGTGLSSLYFIGDTTDYLTETSSNIVINKTIDYNSNTIINLPSTTLSYCSGLIALSTTSGAVSATYPVTAYTHTLGKIPQRIIFRATAKYYRAIPAATGIYTSDGVYDSSGNKAVISINTTNDKKTDKSSTACVYLYDLVEYPIISGSVTAVSSSNFTVSWAIGNNTPTLEANILWSAE